MAPKQQFPEEFNYDRVPPLSWFALPASASGPGERPQGRVAPSGTGTSIGSEDIVSRFLLRERERQVLELLHRHGSMPLPGKKILDVGCGTGKWLRDFLAWGAEPSGVLGVELLQASAARARRLCPDGVVIECGNAAELRFPSQSFDIVLQATLLSSVPDSDTRQAIASEMLRVVRPEGLILWYDVVVENPWNSCVHPMHRSEIRQLFPGCALELQRVGLTPQIARFLAPRSWRASAILSALPPFCTHYLGAIRPSLPA